MKNGFKAMVALSATLAGACAKAHVLWINVVPNADEHVLLSVAYGDFLPGSEILSTEWGAMTLDSYDLVAPDGARSSLRPPAIVAHPKQTLPSQVSVQAGGDVGVRKITFSSSSTQGTYQVAGQTPVYQYTHYRDQAGNEHYTDQPIKKVKDVAEVIDRSFEIMFMKSTFDVGGWTEPQPLGQLFEIVPLSDLSALRVGDTVRFKVLFDGRAWNPQRGSPQITAQSMNLGNRWGLYSPLAFGEGEFRVLHAGLWKINARFNAPVGTDERYKKLAPGAAADDPIYFETTFVMNVAP